jgi:hypothetical protein
MSALPSITFTYAPWVALCFMARICWAVAAGTLAAGMYVRSTLASAGAD